MKDPVRRESLVTIIVLSLLASLFIFGVFLPSQKTERAIRREIAEAGRSIAEIPVRVAELDNLAGNAADRQRYLETTRALIPGDADVHTILGQVASLAAESQLTVTRLEPLKAVSNDTYEVLPIHVSLSGRYVGMLRFLKGLEEQRRLLAVEDLSIRKNGESGDFVHVDIQFNAYVNREKRDDFAQNGDSSGRAEDDRNTR